jgi:hypothetical protein
VKGPLPLTGGQIAGIAIGAATYFLMCTVCAIYHVFFKPENEKFILDKKTEMSEL